jgi:hypothetical protein
VIIIEAEVFIRDLGLLVDWISRAVDEPHPEAIIEVWPVQAVLGSHDVQRSATIGRTSLRMVVASVGHIIIVVSNLLFEIVHLGLLSELLTVQRDRNGSGAFDLDMRCSEGHRVIGEAIRLYLHVANAYNSLRDSLLIEAFTVHGDFRPAGHRSERRLD